MNFHRWFAGFFLLILMVVTLFMNSVMFSARSFQDNLYKLAPETGGVISLAQLEQVRADVRDRELELQPLRGEEAQLEMKLAAVNREIEDARAAIAKKQAEVLAAVSASGASAAPASATPTPTPAPTTTERASDTIGGNRALRTFNLQTITRRLDQLAARSNLSPESESQIEAARAGMAAIAELETLVQTKERERADVQASLDRLQEQVAASEAGILGLKGQYGISFDRIEGEARALKASSPFSLSSELAAMHPTFLSTILACSMGALGAILYLFPAYLNPDNKITFVVIVVRMVFGMVTALAFYIVANVLGVSITATPDTSGALNPFMVAFLGIIAGIMADEIANWIMERGREILGGGASPPTVTISPNTGALAGIADPFLNAARDALPDRAAAAPAGEEPPRGGVQG